MNFKRSGLAAALFTFILLSGLAWFRSQPVAAQTPEGQAPIPKAWGRLVAPGVFPTGGSALVFEAPDGTVRIYDIKYRGVLVFPRN